MGGFLGVIAGGGMLLLIGALFFAFLRQAGAIKPGQAKRLGMAAGMTLGLGLAYWLLGGLFYGVLFEPVAGIAEFNAIFRTADLEKMYIALENPAFYGLFSGIFAYLGHFLGRILFGQYLFAGVVLALCMTLASVFLLMSRLEMILGEKEAQNGAFLLLCLPGALFLFLPGGAPLILLTLSVVFYFVGKKIPACRLRIPEGAYSWLIGISGIFSAAVVFGAVMGLWS